MWKKFTFKHKQQLDERLRVGWKFWVAENRLHGTFTGGCDQLRASHRLFAHIAYDIRFPPNCDGVDSGENLIYGNLFCFFIGMKYGVLVAAKVSVSVNLKAEKREKMNSNNFILVFFFAIINRPQSTYITRYSSAITFCRQIYEPKQFLIIYEKINKKK